MRAGPIPAGSAEASLLNTLKLQAAEESNVLREFQAALLQADAKILDEAAQHPELRGMGTTLTLAFAAHWTLFVAEANERGGKDNITALVARFEAA